MRFCKYLMTSMLLPLLIIVLGCDSYKDQENSYANDVDLLKKHAEVLELALPDGNSRLAIVPQWGGRIMTSTFNGLNGRSLGWMNREVLMQNNISLADVAGGEDRLWIGPLGSQFSFYYQQKKPIHNDNWSVPDVLNEPFQIIQSDSNSVFMNKIMRLRNFIGTQFYIKVKREIHLLNNEEIIKYLGKIPGGIRSVAFESRNTLINISGNDWFKETGLPSVWNLGMFEGTDKGICIIPLKKSVTRNEIRQYLSKAGDDRLKVRDDKILYRVDGKFRNKIGIPSKLCLPVFGSYHPHLNLLTVVQFRLPGDSLYFNSEVSIQENPYDGDPVQIYNDGRIDLSVSESNRFYEMESSSPMKETLPGDSIWHYHRVYHFSGSKESLNIVLEELFDLSDVHISP